MPLTIDQINAELTASPELKKTLLSSLKNDVIEGMKAEGTIVRSKDEETSFLTNYENNIIPGKVQAEIGPKVKAVHDQYDNDLFEILGVKKLPNQKTYDFLKEQLSALKEKAEKGGGGDPVLKDKIKQLEQTLKDRENFVDPTELDKVKAEYFTQHVGLRLSNSLEKKAIAVPAHITDEKAKQSFIEQQRRFIKTDFLTRFTPKQDEKGNIVFYEGDKLQTDTKTAAALTEDQLIESHYNGYFVPAKKPTGGAGSGGGYDQKVDADEANLKTKAEVIAHLKKKGLKQGGTDFNKEYSRILKEYAITEAGE